MFHPYLMAAAAQANAAVSSTVRKSNLFTVFQRKSLFRIKLLETDSRLYLRIRTVDHLHHSPVSIQVKSEFSH
jgi:hypothetical protein